MTDQQEKTAQSTATKNKRSRFSFTLILALVALALSAYTVIQLYQQQKTQQSKALTEQSEWQQFQIKTLAQTRSLSSQLQQQSQHLETLESAINQLSADNDHSLSIRTLSNVSFLIHTANLTLAATHNTSQAANTLLFAKKLLQKENNSRFLNLQQALTHDIAVLNKESENVKPNKIMTQLDTLQDQINALSFTKDKNFHATKPVPPETAQTQETHWYSPITKILSGFKGLIVIRHHQDDVPAIRSEEQMQAIQRVLTLKITIAQWALTQSNNALFHSNLEFVKQWLPKLSRDQKQINSIAAAIKDLSLTELSTTKITSLSSVAAINALYTNNTALPKKQQPSKSAESNA